MLYLIFILFLFLILSFFFVLKRKQNVVSINLVIRHSLELGLDCIRGESLRFKSAIIKISLFIIRDRKFFISSIYIDFEPIVVYLAFAILYNLILPVLVKFHVSIDRHLFLIFRAFVFKCILFIVFQNSSIYLVKI